jgi:hypothetical protein
MAAPTAATAGAAITGPAAATTIKTPVATEQQVSILIIGKSGSGQANPYTNTHTFPQLFPFFREECFMQTNLAQLGSPGRCFE